MPSLRVIRFAELPPEAWANGLGTTTELVRSPASGDFDWRLSIATVGTAARFSLLPGIDRALMALAPDGLDLEMDGLAVSLARHEVLDFAGESTVAATGGPAGHDLNLMVRRGVGTPVLELVAVDGRFEAPATAIAVVTLDGTLTALGAGLEFGDTVVGDTVAGGSIAIRGSGRVAVASVRR
jgi:environmental stress-induced protein Ves